jgi:hypothetical protein
MVREGDSLQKVNVLPYFTVFLGLGVCSRCVVFWWGKAESELNKCKKRGSPETFFCRILAVLAKHLAPIEAAPYYYCFGRSCDNHHYSRQTLETLPPFPMGCVLVSLLGLFNPLGQQHPKKEAKCNTKVNFY